MSKSHIAAFLFGMCVMIAVFVTCVFLLNEETWVNYDTGASRHVLSIGRVVLRQRAEPLTAFAQAKPNSALVGPGDDSSWHIARRAPALFNPLAKSEYFEGGQVLSNMYVLGAYFTISERAVFEEAKDVYLTTLRESGASAAEAILPDLVRKLDSSAWSQ